MDYIWMWMQRAKMMRTFDVDVVTEVRQIAFGSATNIQQTAKCYPSTVGTSKKKCAYDKFRCRCKWFQGLFSASANAEQCTNVPHQTFHIVRIVFICCIRILFMFRCKPSLKPSLHLHVNRTQMWTTYADESQGRMYGTFVHCSHLPRLNQPT